MTGDFDFRLARDQIASGSDVLGITEGLSCKVLVGGELQLTGWIDDADFDLSDEDNALTITGRGKTGDLIDCSAQNSPGTWTNRTALQIETDLLSPFGLTVTAAVDVGAAFPSFAIQQGERVHEVMERLQKQRALLAIETPDGNVQLVRPSQTVAGWSLIEGVNILPGLRHKRTMKDRYSTYKLVGQAQGRDASGDWLTGAPSTKAFQPTATATDPGVTRYRPLTIINEHQAFDTTLPQRAQWEATVRAGKGQTVTAPTLGWRDPTGAIFTVNQLVPVTAPAVAIATSKTLLVSACHFLLSKTTQTTEIDLTDPRAYSLLDLPDPKKAKKGKKRKGPDPLIGIQQ
jgi:prophage tail gpP-like protein